MSELWRLPVAFIIALGVSAVLSKSMLSKYILDKPTSRSLHVKSVPRTGGVAIAIAVALVMLGVEDKLIVGILVLALVLVVVSLIDDIKKLPILPRLLVQSIVAIAFLEFILNQEHEYLLILSMAIGMIWMINLYNFMDGADGLAGGMTTIGFGVLSYAAASSDCWSLAILDGVVASAAAGFLVLNFSPARLFMGDAGSISLGFLAAASGVLGVYQNIWPTWFPIVIFMPFIFDATVTIIRRLIHHENVWEPHRQHYYQRLIQAGWGHRKTVCLEYLLMCVCAASGLYMLNESFFTQIILLTFIFSIFSILFLYIERLGAQHNI